MYMVWQMFLVTIAIMEMLYILVFFWLGILRCYLKISVAKN